MTREAEARRMVLDEHAERATLASSNLAGTALAIREAQLLWVQADADYRQIKYVRLPEAEQGLADAKSAVAFLALVEGKIDGKNAEQRTMQTEAAWRDSKEVSDAEEEVARWKQALVDAETAVNAAKADLDYAANDLKQHLAQATLAVAILNYLRGETE